MPSLTIAWEYLTGAAVATDPASRERAEWPPHPARVFMAMAAAWFETEPTEAAGEVEVREHEAQGDALRWLESLEEPELWLPPPDAANERSLVTVYVPVNDRAGPSTATLQSVPALTRTKQARGFPQVHVGEQLCALHWGEADGLEAHREALARVCAKVTRIGHSSSLVRVWVADLDGELDLARLERWEPTEGVPTTYCRRIAAGLLDSLRAQTQISRIERFAELVWRIEDAQRAVNEAKGSNDADAERAARQFLKHAKTAYQETFGEPFRKSATPPPRLRPKIGLWTGYRRVDDSEAGRNVARTHFDTDLLVLTNVSGPRLPLAATLSASEALRAVILKRSGTQPAPPWVSGHNPDGAPHDEVGGHLAILPLPFVGSGHADGHLLGMALAFPRDVERDERGRVLGPLLLDRLGQSEEITLTLGRLGVWGLRRCDWSEARLALKPETWTAHPSGSITWASVTPVVLDRFPKNERGDPHQRTAWESEVRAIIADACVRVGLPYPIHIDIGTTSWHVGSPRAVTRRRHLRGATATNERKDTPSGNGFPAYPPRETKAPRPQVHVFLQFAEPVCGPVLLGAGRYRGYGLLKPVGARQ